MAQPSGFITRVAVLSCSGITACAGDGDAGDKSVPGVEQLTMTLSAQWTDSVNPDPLFDPRHVGHSLGLEPVLHCVGPRESGKLVAHFGYTSAYPKPVVVPVGLHNLLAPPPWFKQQPTLFLPGEHQNVLAVALNAHQRRLDWQLGSVRATAYRDSPSCVPSFAGLESATMLSANEVLLVWTDATDHATPPGELRYSYCQATAPGDCASNSATYQQATDTTSAVVQGLDLGVTYYFAVRAQTALGYSDGNTVEISVRTCDLGSTVCQGACTAPATDPLNCGSCGNACASGVCASGRCCAPEQQRCAGSCTTTASDPMNCGACGNQCPEGHSCSAGRCQAPVSRIAVGKGHLCRLTPDQVVECWGDNAYGQLGNGTTISSSIPTIVPNLTGVKAISAGEDYTCAVVTGGSVVCWGRSVLGQESLIPVAVTGSASHCEIMGDGEMLCSHAPLGSLGELGGATTVSVSGTTACSVISDGVIACWGLNSFGQLGNSDISPEWLKPVAAVSWWTRVTSELTMGPVLRGARAVSSGRAHACALFEGGTVSCWGANLSGELGNGVFGGTHRPSAVVELSGASAIGVGGNHTCAIVPSGNVECWGSNATGQLGNGTRVDTATPVLVPELYGVTEIAPGEIHTCALTQTGTVACWGSNEGGSLGDATTASVSLTPVFLSLRNVIAISTSSFRTCAQLLDESIQCWGDLPKFPLPIDR